MADGRDQAPGYVSFRATFPWVQIFRCFGIALDPRNLLAAAAGILVMSFGWYLLSTVFYYPEPPRSADIYSTDTLTREGIAPADIPAVAEQRYQEDLAQWRALADLAGPNGGRFRTMPWYEDRGPNPFLFVTDVIAGSPDQRRDAFSRFLAGSVPVLVEPLVKLLLPVAKIVAPGISPQTRVYLFLVIVWFIAVWAFFGGVITRIAAVRLANKGPITLRQAARFVATRYVSYLSAPLIPLGIIAAVILGLIVYGLLGMIPVVGDLLLLGLGLPVVILGGAAMAVFLVGLVGYPLTYTTMSAEGDTSDAFDALSRSINYVYQCPWHYIWYWLLAVLYGAAVTFFVLFFTSLMVYVGKWAVSLPAGLVYADRKPDFLFIYAPESFEWRQLLLQDSPYAVRPVVPVDDAKVKGGRVVRTYEPANPAQYQQKRGEFYLYNTWGAGLVAFWLTLLFLMMLGFTYSYFWSAAMVIYLLLRRKVDESEPDEVFMEEDEPEAPLAPPKMPEGAGGPSAGGGTSLPMIPTPPAAPPVPPPPVASAPILPPVVTSPPVVLSPPPPPATVPVTEPPATPPESRVTPAPDEELDKDDERPT